MIFRFLCGDVNWKDYGGKWISPKQNPRVPTICGRVGHTYDDEIEYYLVIDFTNMRDACGPEAHASYHVSLDIVSPTSAGADKLRQAIRDVGVPEDQADNPICQVEALHTNGLYAVLWSRGGNNARSMMAEARHWAQRVSSLLGFYLDRPQNKIGSTGWDLIKGDVMAGLDREPDNPAKKLMRKMQGGA